MNFKLFAAVILTMLWVGYAVEDIRVSFEYDNTIQSYWDLSVKASTLKQKSEYLNKFVDALDREHLSGSAAMVWQTPDEDYAQNYTALKSLQQRMDEIQTMDVKSFEYQQAISQITAQEMEEAHHILGVFESTWRRQLHYAFWGWSALFFGLFGCIAVIVSWCIYANSSSYDY